MTVPGLQLGAPGVYQAPELPDRSLRPVRLDVAGFVGVAPRGPLDAPTLVRSWSDYQLRFGGFEGAGRLPYAVSVFFDQGGERAYVLRVGPPGPRPAPENDDSRTLLELDLPGAAEPVRFVAANPGAWGNGLTVRLEFDATPQFPLQPLPTGGVAPTRDIRLPDGLAVPAGSLLRLRGPGRPPAGELRWVDAVEQRDLGPGPRLPVAVLDRPVTPADPGGRPIVAAVVTGTLVVLDADPEFPRSERLTGLGLDGRHPAPLAVAVRRDSLLVRLVGDWTQRRLEPPDPLLTPVPSRVPPLREGRDIDDLVAGTSFFDERADLDLDDELDPDAVIAPTADDDPYRLRGASGVARVAELGLLAVPDLFWDWLDVLEPPETDPAPGSATFRDCAPPPLRTTYRRRTAAVLLDATTPGGRDEILTRQERLVALAEQYRRFVALLDVPQHLDTRGIARWRAGFDSSYAAAYHPWLGVLRAVGAGSTTPVSEAVPPSAFAAGIVAARERRLGLPWGPANELAAGAVIAAAAVTAAEHDALHPLGINVFRAERDGYRLTAARTLAARDRYVRQLSVRRLLTMLRLALDREMQWVVFEPNTAALRELLRHTLLVFLRGLYRFGAFTGDTEEQAFFVRVDDGLNPPASVDLGRLVVEVGVAPAEPLEFIVLRITRDGDGGVRVVETTTDG